MKNTFKFFVILFLFALAVSSSSFADNGGPSDSTKWPTFNMTAQDISMQPGANGQDSIIYWNVYLLQTNYGQAGIDPFEFCCAQYNWYYNTNIWRNPTVGNMVLTNLGGQTDIPVGIRPPTFQVDSTNNWGPNIGLLKTSGNLPNSSINYFIGNVFPGTKMLQMKLYTNGKSFNQAPIDLQWRTGLVAPNTFLAYFTPNLPTGDTASPQWAQSIYADQPPKYNYVVENGTFVLPVELASFVSTVAKNNVELDWSTATETNNQQFEIERSVANSTEWTKVGTVQGSGTTTEVRNYKFTEQLTIML